MMIYDYRLPNITEGNYTWQLEQIKQYLSQTGEQLTFAMNALANGGTSGTENGKSISLEDIKAKIRQLETALQSAKKRLQAIEFREYEKDGWSVRQYASGTVELWREYETSCTCTSAWGALWREEGAVKALPFPLTFDTAPCILVTAHGVDYPYFLAAESASASDKTGSYSVVSAEGKETIGVRISFYVRGTVLI